MAAKRGRGAELNALRKKKQDEKAGVTTKPQSSVSSNTNKNGGGRTGGLTRQEVAQKVYNAPGYSQGSTTKAYREKYPSRSGGQDNSGSTRNNTANPYATKRNIVNRDTTSTSQKNSRRGRINASDRSRGRAQQIAELKKKENPVADTAREMMEERKREADAKTLKRRSRPATAMELRMQRTKDLASGRKDDKVTETIKNTGGASKKGLLDSLSGHAQTALDALSELTSDEDRNYTMLRAAELSAGIDNKAETRKAAKGTVKTSEVLDEERKKLNAKQEQRQAEWDKKTKNASGLQKAIYGAAESGTGMATDMAVGALTGTGQTGALASMFSRTYGTTRGQAEKEGATENEDRLNAGLQAVKEVGTELMFPGWGLAKGYAGKTGIKAGEKLANALTKNMRGRAADAVYAGVRLIGGTAEENAEEIAGWGLDPFIKDLAYGRNVRKRAKESLIADLPQLTSREDAERLNARLNSGGYVEELAAEFKANGLSDKKARELAEMMRDLYSAYYAGDTETVDKLGDDIAGELTGQKKVSMESFNRSELLETLASTTLLTATTGLPGTVTTAQRGSQIKNDLGADGLKALAKDVLNSEDEEASERGKIAQAALESGRDITATQAFDLEQGLYKQQEKDAKRQAAQLDTAGTQIERNNYVTPIAVDDYGRVVYMEKATNKAYNEAAESASETLDHVDTKESLTDTDKTHGARAIAGFKTGAFTIDDANTIVADETIKDAFKAETGIDLSQYEVKNRDGSINIPKTNAAIKDALFAMASDNLIKSAEAETATWMDETRGETVKQVTARMGAKGGVAVQIALDGIDERDVMQYRTMAAASDYVYQSARNVGLSWDEARDTIVSQFSTIPEEKLQVLYEAGLEDRQAANDKMLGLQTKIGEAMSKSGERIDPTKGQVLVETEETPGGSVIQVFSDIADSLGVNIHLVDELPNNANGQYYKDEIWINVNSAFEENLGYIFMHEVTHHLKKYAPEQYQALEDLVRERWFNVNPDQMQNAIAEKIALYDRVTNGKQKLTEAEALEEIIADSAHEFLMDKNFADQVSKKDPSLGKAVLSAIKNMLRKLRQIFSSGKYENSRTSMDAVFNQLGILEEAEKLWLNAYTEAVKNKAAVGLVEWQDNAFDEARYSITPEQDTDYMQAVERGDMETAQRMVDEAAAEAMPNTKLTGRWFHGTENEFTEFNFSQGGKNGHADGYGIYLTNDPEVASSYGTRMIEGYVNVERPASALTSATLTRAELHRLIERTVNAEAETLKDEGYDSIDAAKFDTWISNYTDTYYAGNIDKSIDEVIDAITNINGNDYDIVLEIMTGMGIRDYDEASKFYDILTEETGIDGFETKWGDESEMADPNTPTIALAFRSEQIKDSSPVTYDDDGKVIPLSERFNMEKKDIRYSFTTDQEDLIKNGNLPKSLRDWAKEIGLDEISKQPTKGPVEVSVKSLRSAWYQKNDREDEAEVVNKVLDTIGKSLTNMIGKYNYIDLGDAVNASVHYRTDKDGKPISVILTCQVKNAEYEVNFDFTTICSKRLAMQRVLERFIKTEGESKGTLYDELKLDEEGMYKLRLILEKAGFEVSCKGCFVEQNRYSQQAQAKTIADDWNKAIDEWEKENNTKVTENFDLVNMDINALDYEEIQEAFDRYGELIKGRETNVASKNRTLIEAHPFFRKRMNPSDYASMAGQRALMAIGAKGGRNLYGLLKRGQSDSKQSVPFTAYNGEIALLPDNMKGRELFDYLMSIGGARAQSASDFQIEYFYDYMQLVADLSARGLPMHMYTKVIELAELFGMTGVKINLSAMCDVDESLGGEYAGLKLVNGKYEYNISDQSIDYEKAVELQKKPGYSKNIGIIMVVLSKQHMLKSLDDNDVRYIIGYHSSSMPAVVAQMTNMGNATDYTKLNKTNKLNDKGKALFAKAMEQAKGKTKLAKYKDALRIFDDMIQEEVSQDKKPPRRGNEYARYMSVYGGNTAEFNTYDNLKDTNDARKTADNYIEWCMNNDLIPIYFPFAFHDNYYKCEIYDFNMYDNVDGSYAPMEAVQNIYPDLDMTKGETDSTKFMETVTEMMDERNKINEGLDSMYDNVFDEAKNELKFSITGDEYLDFDEADIDRTQLTPRAEAIKTEAQKRDEAYMSAVNSGNMDEAQRLVDEAAKKAGYIQKVFHGTPSSTRTVDPYGVMGYDEDVSYDNRIYPFTTINPSQSGGIYTTITRELAEGFSGKDAYKLGYRDYPGTVFDLYVRLDNPLVVDEHVYDGVPFYWEIPTPSVMKDAGYTQETLSTEEISAFAQEHGYDGVIIEGLREGSGTQTDDYIVFNPESLKSADTITYADDGSVIPLSERFDPNNNDIRYSLPTQDSYGNILTDGQMDYFRNSKARDSQGRLVPVYHTTNKGGFTIFDPSYSDDKRSLFFASNFDVSQTYGAVDANKSISIYNMEGITDADSLRDYIIKEAGEYAGTPFNVIPNDEYEQLASVDPDFTMLSNHQSDYTWDTIKDEWEPYKEDHDNTRAFIFDMYMRDVESGKINPDDYTIILKLPNKTSNEYFDGAYAEGHSIEDLVNDIRASINSQYGSSTSSQREQHGYYKCYLNLENPMIIDANGDYWNAIHYDDDGVRIQDDAIYKFNQIKITHNEEGINLLIFGESKDADELWSNFKVNESFDDTDGLYEYLLYTIGLDDNYVEDIFALANKEGNVNYWTEDYIGANGDLLDEEDYSENTYNTRQIASIAESLGHDGVIIRNLIDHGGKSAFDGIDESSDIYIAFSSNQVKDINNENPTENPDIRYSIPPEDEIKAHAEQRVENINEIPLSDPALERNRLDHMATEDAFIDGISDSWERRILNLDKQMGKTPLKNSLIGIMKQVRKGSNTDRQYKAETLNETIKSIKSMYKLARKNETEAFARKAWETAERIVDDIDYNDALYQEYKDIKGFFDNTMLAPGELWGDREMQSFASANSGKMRFTYHPINALEGDEVEIDQAYRILRKQHPNFFPDEVSDPIEQLMQMQAVLDNTDAYRDAYTSEEHAKLVEEVANNLCNIVSEGKEFHASIGELNVNAMKLRHEEALYKVTERRNHIADFQRERADMWKQRYQDRIKKEGEDRAEKKSRREHRKSFDRIEADYNKLCKWVLEPTKEKNVPEEFRKSLAEFLQTLDLQTENSKKLEEKTGHVAGKTFKMRELRDRLADLSESGTDDNGEYVPPLFEIDANVDFILKKLADKLDKNGNTIDALDNEDIASIEVFMKLLIRNIERYKQVKLENKQAEISEIGERCVSFLRDKRDRDGIYGKREGVYGALDTINITALTPAYLFDRMGPLKEMYDVLRHNGFDTYIRNEKLIIDRMTSILGDYYKGSEKKPRPGSEIEEWRDNRSAQTIELEHGKNITMTVAQMMSLYCLVNRGTQATDHMTIGGIVVTPIQEGSKIQQKKDKLKGKRTAETSQKRVLTEADMQTIISKLTPEQIKIADQLQELMSKEMARLGNEAHRDLYGYNNFTDPNYFPIKVSGNELSTDINTIGDVVEKIKSYGPAKPVTPGARNALVIDDIFTVVADHCNGMNLYNSYLVPITDFMKVLNYSHTFEDGEVLTMKDAIEQAYGKDVLKYIMNLMKDINGIKADNRGGLEGIMNDVLGKAKKTAVFGNIRVALQQPTAIVRACAIVDPKYFAGIKINALNGEARSGVYDEMYKYCPIALWKSWGYYDTYMGRDIEDVMMNNWSKADVALSGIYGSLDNATWSAIWQAVKKEQMDKHPNMDHNSEEFLQMCGRRASEVFDKTQVVDSTFHRSDAMRSKQVAVKAFTAFMAEPTLTLNVLRGALFNASEMRKAGDHAGANRVTGRAIAVLLSQAITVAAAQAFADAWRGKDPGLPWGDDDDEEKDAGYWTRWLHNFIYNTFDQLHLENNMYLIKDVTPYINFVMSKVADYGDWPPLIRAIMGWDQDYLYSQNNLIFSSLENTANGISQAFKKLEKGEEYDKGWYEIIQKTSSLFGVLTGIPASTLMRDFKPIWDKIVPAVFAADSELEKSYSKSDDTTSSKTSSGSAEGENESHEGPSGKYLAGYDAEAEKIASSVADKTGEEKEKATWKKVSAYIKEQEGASVEELVSQGKLNVLEEYRDMYTGAGNSADYFNERIMAECKSEFKKTILYDPSRTQKWAQGQMRQFMQDNGMSDAEISEMAYKSETAKDLKVAMRIGDRELVMESLQPLADAGLIQEDLDKLWENRNRVDLKAYKDKGGRYADKLKSMGTFIWPTKGVVTSHFGYRNSPTAGASSNHPAIDIGAATGTPVVAADGGVVIYAGNNGGYGNSVGVKHDNGMVTYYNHLYAWNVKVGDSVAQGQQVGQVGSTGISTGPHLDFKILDKNGKPVDPEKYLN